MVNRNLLKAKLKIFPGITVTITYESVFYLVDIFYFKNYSKYIENIVGWKLQESVYYKPPKEQASIRPLKRISQVEETATGHTSGESVWIDMPPKGNGSIDWAKLSGKRTEKGREKHVVFLCLFVVPAIYTIIINEET